MALELHDNDIFPFVLAGGSGIHRPLGGREGIGGDYKSKVSPPACRNTHCRGCWLESIILSVYSFNPTSPQKGKGDVKKKGKLDPYAYVPLKKAQLNRRYWQQLLSL